MMELFKICPKIQFFDFFYAFLRMQGVNLVSNGVKGGFLMCQ